MDKVKITKEDIFAGNYISQKSPKMKRSYRPIDSLLPYIKGVLFVCAVIALYMGYSVYRDFRLTRMITKQRSDGSIVKLVELWTGDKVSVEEEYVRTGEFFTGGSFYFKPGEIKGFDIIVKDKDGRSVCMNSVGITKSIGKKLNRIIENKEEYKNRTISISGYGTKYRPDKMALIVDGQIIKVACDEVLRLYVSGVK